MADLADIYAPLRRTARIERATSPNQTENLYDPTPEEEEGIFQKIVSGTLSGIGMAGNLLDLPGSSVRDLITGNNPLDQWLSPLSPENRATGRDVTTHLGITSANKPTGWVPLEDPGEFAQDAVGFMAELALDPLAWATGWAKSGTKAARMLEVAKEVRAIEKATGKVSMASRFDQFGNALNSLDPGYHVGRMVRAGFGEQIERGAKVVAESAPIKKVTAGLEKAKGRYKSWLGRYDQPMVSRELLEADISSLQKSGDIPVDAGLLTELTAEQQLMRRVFHGFGADTYFFGGSKEPSQIAGVRFSGVDNKNRIWVSGDRVNVSMLGTIAHETLHLMRDTDPKAYDKMLSNILELADDPQKFMEESMLSYGPRIKELSPGLKVEEGVAKAHNIAFEDFQTYQAIAQNPAIKPHFQRAFKEVMEVATRHTTDIERKTINEELGRLLFGQRDITAKGPTSSTAAQATAGRHMSNRDWDKVQDYTKGMEEVWRHPEETRNFLERTSDHMDDFARRGLLNLQDIGERIRLAANAQLNYKVLGRITGEGQAMGKTVTEKFESIGPLFQEPIMAITNQLNDVGKLLDDNAASAVRRAVELDEYHHLKDIGFENLNELDNFQAAVKSLRRSFITLQQMGADAGMKKSVLDDVVNWFARGMTPEARKRLAGGYQLKRKKTGFGGAGDYEEDMIFSAASAGQRTGIFRHHIDGTDGWNEITGSRAVLGAVKTNHIDHATEMIENGWKASEQYAGGVEKFEGWGKRLDPRMPHSFKKDNATYYTYRTADGEIKKMTEGDLYGAYDRVAPSSVRMRNDEAFRLNEYQQPWRMEPKEVKMPDTDNITPDDLREMGVENEDLLGMFDELESFGQDEMDYFEKLLQDEVYRAQLKAQTIELATHETWKDMLNHGYSADELKAIADDNGMSPGGPVTRYRKVAEWMGERGIANELETQGGLFRNNAIAEVVNRVQSEVYKIAVAQALPNLFGNLFSTGALSEHRTSAGVIESGKTLSDIFTEHFAHINRDRIYDKMLSNPDIAKFAQADKNWRSRLGRMRIPPKIYEDLTAVKEFHELPVSLQGTFRVFSGLTAMFKAGVLTHPARYSRDFLSGQVANYLNNLFSLESAFRAMDVLTGKPNEALVQNKHLRAYAERVGYKKAAYGRADIGDLVDTPKGQSTVVELMKGTDNQGKYYAKTQNGEYVIRHEVPVLKKSGGDDAWFNPDVATASAREYFAALRGNVANLQHEANLQDVETLYTKASAPAQVGEALPGTHQRWRDVAEDVGRNIVPGMADRAGVKSPTLRFWEVEGVPYMTGPRAKEGLIRRRGQTGFEEMGAVKAGGILQKNSDDMNRMVGWLEGMRQGMNPEDAFKRVNRIQLDYRPHTFGPLERNALKKVFPFYSFFSRQSAYLAHELMTNPAGRLGKLIRLQSKAQPGTGPESFVPQHVREQMAMPIPDREGAPEGESTYLTGLGLMHEDPLTTIFGSLRNSQGGFRNLISKMNPLLKAPIEWGTGRTTFQGGPTGGRDINELDPAMGRTLVNLGLRDELPDSGAAPFISRSAEFIASNSPMSRVITSLRTMSDHRKTKTVRALNLLTGLRFATVSPEQRRGAFREVGNAIARDAGVPEFSSYDATTDFIRRKFEEDPELAEQLMFIKRDRARVSRISRADNRRDNIQTALSDVEAGKKPTLNKGQSERHKRWIRNNGRRSVGTEAWATYVFQAMTDGTPSQSGIRDWPGGRFVLRRDVAPEGQAR